MLNPIFQAPVQILFVPTTPTRAKQELASVAIHLVLLVIPAPNYQDALVAHVLAAKQLELLTLEMEPLKARVC